MIFVLLVLKMLKTPNFDVTLFNKNEWEYNTYISCDITIPYIFMAMYKGKIEAMATKCFEKFAINVLKKHRKFRRRGLTHMDATSIFKKSFRYL